MIRDESKFTQVDWKKWAKENDGYMIAWVVKVDKLKCYMEHFSEAWSDFKSHEKAFIYPVIISKSRFNYDLPEFKGW